MKQYLIDRAAEPATWASISAMLGGFGLSLPPSIWQSVTLAGMGAAGLAGVLLKEGRPPGG